MLIHDEFLVRRTVLYADFLAFQLINAGVFALLTHEQRGVVVIWRGKQHLLFTFRRDIHSRHYSVEAAEFQAGDQAVERLIGKGTGGVDLFT